MSARIDVFISSTSLDLPAHRKQALDACLRMGMFPVMMEHLPSSSAGAITASLSMVDEAEIYVGIYAHRYGYIPDGHEISITEMEYNHAVERGIPRLIFIIGNDHSPTDVETGSAAQKLKTFRQRVTTENIVNFFSSPEDLRGQIIQSLVPYREIEKDELHSQQACNIPAPPTPYIAHPYTLLQTSRLIGRQKELQLLNNWVSNPSRDVYKAAIMNVVAIGGMGKSALTWTWFTDIMPHLMDPLAGRLWWSFYESDARFENFVTRALAYVTNLPVEQIENTMHPGEREDMLLQQLDSRPFLLVLDGLERILVAYSRMDAAYLADDELDVQTANHVADALGLPAAASHSFTGQHRSRKTTNPRAGNFLRKLATVRASKILVSTRLFPADLQTSTGHAMPGTFAYFLTGLSDDDAVQLWREFGVSGSRDNLLPVFNAFENYPLLIRALAGEVARFRRAPGDFDRWLDSNPDFNPLDLTLANVKSHVLYYALQGIELEQLKVLQTIAGFRMPATYDTLAALLVGNHFTSEDQLDIALTELEDRGLVGWDKLANRYDLHPIVRGVVWNGLNHEERQDIHESLYDHFSSLPRANTEYYEVDSLDELTAANELYHALIGLGKYDMAFEIFRTRLSRPLLYRLGANQELVRLLEMLFPGGIDTRP
ncbi:MAG: DUF4062 domain-containing protein, partial [Chloroflexi bacterium]|nr:DUF4062 domain-containing protein [Chloroflexota bacterium]